MSVDTATAFIIDDDASVLKALSRLTRSAGINALTFNCAQAFLDKYDRAKPGCLVLDIAMPKITGLELQRALADRVCTLPIIFLSGHVNVPMSVQAMKFGALDVLTKPVNDTDLLRAIRLAFEKDLQQRKTETARMAIAQQLTLLTPREREVFEHVVSGRLNKQIAADLGTVEKTIKVHRARVMQKLGADSLADLVRLSERLAT